MSAARAMKRRNNKDVRKDMRKEALIEKKKELASMQMAAERGKEIGRHLMIVAELAATVRIGQRDTAAGGGETVGEIVDATDRRHDPNLVTDPDTPVLAPEALEHRNIGCKFLRLGNDRLGLVLVFQALAEIRCGVVHVNMVADGDVRRGV